MASDDRAPRMKQPFILGLLTDGHLDLVSAGLEHHDTRVIDGRLNRFFRHSEPGTYAASALACSA